MWQGIFSYSPPHKKISCLRSHEKISCLKRKSHVLSVPGHPQRENLLPSVSWENLMSQGKISCLISFGFPPIRKSAVSCLVRKYHVSRENLISYQFWAPPPKRKSPVSCLMRKSHVQRENLMSFQFWVPFQWKNLLSPVSWENLMSQEKISCLISLGPPQWENLLSPVSKENLLSHEKFSCLMLSP